MADREIWKFPLGVGRNVFEMPLGARLLSVGEQQGHVVLWAAVEPLAEPCERVVWVVGTGHKHAALTGDLSGFVGTVQVGEFVWHVFEGEWV